MNRTDELWRIWMRYAKVDLVLTADCIERGDSYLHMAAFHAQQASEKAIKGFAISRLLEFKKTHDLNALLAMLEDQPDFETKLYTLVAVFDDFSINTRYPDFGLSVTNKEANALYGVAKEIYLLIEKLTSYNE